MATEKPEELLREHGLRVTATRLAVLNVLSTAPHADADLILQGVRAAIGSASVQAIYDVLTALTNAGVVRRIEPAGHPTRYEMRVGDNHHHLVCRSCGTLADVDCAAGHTPCLNPISNNGFIVDEAEVVYWGTCGNCQRKIAS